jgi:hypothetical protein
MTNKCGRGSLRAVENPKTEKHPTYTGSLEIDGRKFWLAGWRKRGDDGKYWLSLSVEAADPPEQTKPAKSYANRRDYDDQSF